MILCFSGTGNSRYVADAMAEGLDDLVVDLQPHVDAFVRKWGAYPTTNKLFAQKGAGSKTGPTFVSDDGEPFVVVCPLYGWRIPEAVSGIIESANFIGSDKLYVVATYGDETANADIYAEQSATKAGMTFCGFTGIVMPSTYSKVKKMPNKEHAREIRIAAKAQIDAAVDVIKRGAHLYKKDQTMMGSLKSGAMHRSFQLYEAGSHHFVVSNKCTRCGRCELFCPVRDITMTDTGILFGDRCISCYACIHRCPDSAIDVRGMSEGNGRYICPSYREEMEDLRFEAAREAKRAAKAAARAAKEAERAAVNEAADLAAAVAISHGVDPEAAKAAADAAGAAALTPKRGGRLAAKREANARLSAGGAAVLGAFVDGSAAAATAMVRTASPSTVMTGAMDSGAELAYDVTSATVDPALFEKEKPMDEASVAERHAHAMTYFIDGNAAAATAMGRTHDEHIAHSGATYASAEVIDGLAKARKANAAQEQDAVTEAPAEATPSAPKKMSRLAAKRAAMDARVAAERAAAEQQPAAPEPAEAPAPKKMSRLAAKRAAMDAKVAAERAAAESGEQKPAAPAAPAVSEARSRMSRLSARRAELEAEAAKDGDAS